MARWPASDIHAGEKLCLAKLFQRRDRPITAAVGGPSPISICRPRNFRPSTPATRRICGSCPFRPPFFRRTADGRKKFLGVVAMSFNVGERFIELPLVDPTEAANRANQFAVLVDGRQIDHTGESDGKPPGYIILQHPVFDDVIKNDGQLPERFFTDYKLSPEVMQSLNAGDSNYRDPLAADKEAKAYRQRYLAAQAPVDVRDSPTGWIVVVQDSYNQAIGATLAELSGSW